MEDKINENIVLKLENVYILEKSLSGNLFQNSGGEIGSGVNWTINNTKLLMFHGFKVLLIGLSLVLQMFFLERDLVPRY